jgi:hypothetical protein
MRSLSRPQVFGGLVTVVVGAAVVGGIFLVGSPAAERTRRLDERRVQDLAGLARAVDLFWTRHANLPTSLDELRKEPGLLFSSTDPGTREPYQYRPLEAGTYELCARFEQGSRQPGDPFWSHGTGRQCFRREARKVD